MKHGEAFALMTYACEGCGLRETIWNSRDGVTPFVITCAACGASMTHVDWHRDRFAPDHKPRPGDRLFRDATHADYRAAYERRIADGQFPPDVDLDAMVAEAFSHGSPPPWMETAT